MVHHHVNEMGNSSRITDYSLKIRSEECSRKKVLGGFEVQVPLEFVTTSKRFWMVSIGLKFETALEIIFLEESLT